MTSSKIEIAGSEEACSEVIKRLDAVKKALAECKSIEDLHTIMAIYQNIDYAKPQVQNYIKADENKKKRGILIHLLSEIKHLTDGIQLLYGTQKLDFNIQKPVEAGAKPPKIPPKTRTSTEIPAKATEKLPTAPPLPPSGTGKSSAVPPPAPPLKGRDEAIKTIQAIKMVREKHLTEFTNHLKQLQTKREQFHAEYPTHASNDTQTAYGVLVQLIQNLEAAADKYKNSGSTLEQFKTDSSAMINKERDGILSQHRGCKEIIINLLLAIATIGLTYAYGTLFNQGKYLISVNTDTLNMLDETLEAINEVGMSG